MSASKIIQAAAGVGGEPEGAFDTRYLHYKPYGSESITSQSRFYDGASPATYFKAMASTALGLSVPQGVYIHPYGEKIYVVRSNEYVHQADLSTPWDSITFGTWTNFYTGSQTTNAVDLTFKPDGTVMYVVCYSTDKIHQYDLSTAWDVTTATFDASSSALPYSGTQNPSGLWFKDDGTKVFVCDFQVDKVISMDLATAWDISSTLTIDEEWAGINETNVQSICFSADGSKMYELGNTNDRIKEYTLTTPWTTPGSGTTGTEDGISAYAATFNSTFQQVNTGLHVSQCPGYFYHVSDTSDIVTGWQVGVYGGSHDGRGGSDISDDGTVLIRPDSTRVYIHSLSTGWDFTTASANGYVSFSGNDGLASIYDASFQDNGNKLLIMGYNLDQNSLCILYNLSTQWDITTYVNNSSRQVDSLGNGYYAYGGDISEDGMNFAFVRYNWENGLDPRINVRNLSTAFDTNGSTTGTSQFIFTDNFNPYYGVSFNSDGTKVYIPGNGVVREYDLSSAWDVTNMTLANEAKLVGYPRTFRVKGDGTQGIAGSNGWIGRYAMEPAFSSDSPYYIEDYEIS